MSDAIKREIETKLELIREVIGEKMALRLRGTDWFSWITGGGSNVVLLAAEIGIAEVLITNEEAWILTNEIEARRLREEELYIDFNLHVSPWAELDKYEEFIKQITDGRQIVSDRPITGEHSLPARIITYKRCLLPIEVDRYRCIGKLASEAMSQALQCARPDWTENQLAGAGAQALYAKGLVPALVLVAGEKRLPLYRHPTATDQPLGSVAMMVFCARSCGLYANLTRFVSFGKLNSQKRDLHHLIAEIEAEALELSRPGTALNTVYQKLSNAYATHGYPDAIKEHHQGGITGYLSREVVATHKTFDQITVGTALAWNPSLVGVKIEDTFIVQPDGIENLTYDQSWPHETIRGIKRPLVLEK